jgi:nitrate reductase beta subunit
MQGTCSPRSNALRIPIEYLAELFTAGDVVPGQRRAAELAAMRAFMRDSNLGRDRCSIPAAVGMTEEEMYELYRLLAIAKYEDRYVIPRRTPRRRRTSRRWPAPWTTPGAPACTSRVRSGRPPAADPGRGRDLPRLRSASSRRPSCPDDEARVNLLNWDGRGAGGVQAGLPQGAGVEWDEAGELPDHLCAVLQFGATLDADGAWKLLNDHRAGIEMLRLALTSWRNDDRTTGSPWAHALIAL